MAGTVGRLLFSVLAVVGLSACLDSGAGGVEFHRDTKTRISSTTRFDAERFAGKWQFRGEFVHPGEMPENGVVEFRVHAGEVRQIALYNARGRVSDIYDVDQPQAGRFTLGEKPYQTEYWVLWVDEGYRTAAIGTPSGSFGWILDRARSGGEDRVKAAREVFDFNGYNLARLKMN
ncbi:lipocalin family protein [Aliiroseovarius crassostreae]|uniref:Lipocalin family protein n=1 Tax=Aliiroseovarius crassostreae TaxID=154981 RepID=A0A9Q9LW87_9RHOB|nr:lipocalin family protein [Aliiroseovarius crassostreae]UWP94277.1 lipocalin family protein [Aliiroseovarius crassostreae]